MLVMLMYFFIMPYLAWSSVCSSIKEDDSVGIFCSVYRHDWSGPDFYPLLLVYSSALFVVNVYDSSPQL